MNLVNLSSLTRGHFKDRSAVSALPLILYKIRRAAPRQSTDPHSTSARGLSGVALVPGAPQLRLVAKAYGPSLSNGDPGSIEQRQDALAFRQHAEVDQTFKEAVIKSGKR